MAVLKDLIVTGPARATGNVYGSSFVKAGGTSSQFLKADGSVDTNSYALASAIPTVNNATLTLSGGGGLTVSTDPTFTANASSNKTITITHPSATAYASGFYKVTVNDTGHVTAATAVTAADVTTLINGTYIPVASSALGSATKPVYLSGVSSFSECSTYAGGTKVTLNGTDKGASTASFYAPTGSGTSGQYLKSNGSNNAPTWTDFPEDSDTKVKRTLTSGDADDEYPLLTGYTSGLTTSPTEEARYNARATMNGYGSLVLKSASAANTADTSGIQFRRGSATGAYISWAITSQGVSSGEDAPFSIRRGKSGTWTNKLSVYNTKVKAESTLTDGIEAVKFVKTSGTAGQILLANGDNVAASAGTAAKFLTAANGGAPTWGDLPVAGTSQAGIVQLGSASGTAAEGNHTHTGYVSTSTTVTAGTGLTGGGALSGNITIRHADPDTVTTVSYGPETGGTLAHGGTFTVPNIMVDPLGHISKAFTRTFTLPSDANDKVLQDKTDSSNESWRPLIIGSQYASTNPSASTALNFNTPASDPTEKVFATHLGGFQPSTGTLAVIGIKKLKTDGKLDGSATTLWNTNGGVVTIGASGGPAAFDHDHSGVYVPNPSTAGTAGQYLKMGSSAPEWANLPADSDTKVKQSVSTSNTVYRRLLLTYNSTAAASGTITADAENIAYYSNSIMANPGTGEILATKVRATSDLYVGSATTSQCHQQYDATNKCLKFLFD